MTTCQRDAVTGLLKVPYANSPSGMVVKSVFEPGTVTSVPEVSAYLRCTCPKRYQVWPATRQLENV
jgi:hypothetical protein